ncbi:hypothetical protein PI859_30435, partial [Burkholderia pseudomallei]|uniref:hypothetical protein n=1 Tax=Burkholderia pseudomallei TaxID=28450 RepID=UPI0022FE93A3
LYDESYRFFLEFLGKRTPDHGLALQTTRYLLFEPSKGIEPLHRSVVSLPLPSPRRRSQACPLRAASALGAVCPPLRFFTPG